MDALTVIKRMFDVDRLMSAAVELFDAALYSKVDVRAGVGALKKGDSYRPGRTVEGDGSNFWTDSDGEQHERPVAEVANFLFALASKSKHYLKGWKGMAATIVGLMVTANLQTETEIDPNRIRGGFIRNPNKVEKAAFEAAGVKPIMRNGRCVGFAPIDPTDERWTPFADCLQHIFSFYRGSLTRDKDGNEMSVDAVCQMLDASFKSASTRKSAANKKAAATTKALGGEEAKKVTLVHTEATLTEIDSLLKQLYGFDPEADSAGTDRTKHILTCLRAQVALTQGGEDEQAQLEVVNG